MELSKYNSRYVRYVRCSLQILKGLAVHTAQWFGILKKLTILQEELFMHFLTM